MRDYFNKYLTPFKKSNYFPLFAVILIGFFLRIYNLDYQSFWFEELMTISYSEGNGLVHFFEQYYKNPDASPPLYSFLVFLVRNIFPYSDWALRFPSVIFGVGTIIMAYILGKRMVNETTGVFAAICCSSSGALIYYSQELRYNSCLVFFILTFTYFFLVSFDKNSKKTNKYFLIGNIAVLTLLHYLGIVFILEIVFLAWFFGADNKRNFLIYTSITILILIIFYPWLDIFLNQLNSWSIPKMINASPSLWKYFIAMVNYSLFYRTYWERIGVAETELLRRVAFYFYLCLLSVFILYLYNIWKNRINLKKNFSLSLNQVVVWGVFFVNILAFFIIDMRGKNRYFYEKNLLFTLPFFYILVGSIVSKVLKAKETYAVATFIFVLALYTNIVSQKYYSGIFKTEFKQVAGFIASHSTTTPVYVACGDRRWYKYYFLKYELKNVIYAPNKEIILDALSKEKAIWVVCQHHFLNYDLEFELRAYAPEMSYEGQTLTFAKLFKNKQNQ